MPANNTAEELPASPDMKVTWHALSGKEVLEKLGSAVDKGLSKDEAAKRLEKFGLNQLKEGKKTTFLQMVIEQLSSFVVIMLIVAAIISIFLGETVDAIAIITIVVLNTVMGVVQDSRAQKELEALKKMAAPEAMVLRGAHRVSVPARELVPGDIVFLETGNFVPADMRLLEAVNLRIDEAALTGESVPVEKNEGSVFDVDASLGDRKNTAFSGTVVTYGRGKGVVISTGMYTQLGLIATMLQSVEEEETPLQRRLDQLGKTLGYACLVISALVFVAGIIEKGDPLDMFMIAVSLAIAAVPEGLPAVVTISLALGMQEMIKRHALIRKLSSVETLGSATVICSDKTGTLTQNAMTVTRVWVDNETLEITGGGYSPEGEFRKDGKTINIHDFPAISTALWVGTLNNDSQLEETVEDGKSSYRIIGDPTEGSILVAAAKAGARAPELNKAYPRSGEIPFDSDRKRMVTLHEIKDPQSQDISPFEGKNDKEAYVIAVKGAPDVVLGLCNRIQKQDNTCAPLDEKGKQAILAANDNMTKDALRVLGMAYRVVSVRPDQVDSDHMEQDLVFAGLVGMIDPAREEVKPALLRALGAGIRTVMITGDYPNTAKAIAESIGLLRPGHKVCTGAELDKMDDATLSSEVEEIDVFARVSPEHKMRIVSALKANDEVVAMTGDGVNDAPAIKAADIGVAMGITGTDVAKETADMVLTDDNYASIVSAVEQGRVIYANIRKFVYYLISCNMAEIMIIFIPTMFGRFLFPKAADMGMLSPLIPIQLLWLNLVTDGAPALALGTEKGDPDIMSHKPRPPKEPIINRFMLTGVIVQTIAITTTTLIAYAIGSNHADPRYAETLAFVTLVFSELLRAYTARSERYPLAKIGVFTNKWMNWAVLASCALTLIVIYVPFMADIFNVLPMGWEEWRLVIPLFLVPSIAAEVVKYIVSGKKKTA
ncbi:cation-translocating P-type ATPase [Pelolinea submarina]|uniref:Ca2+-transporting ATPase n=1 Tax=Pelolinea submarina TaxID=913107 RepID=A0A347ZP65_9CHLR|nr:cation-translocating P-type ATPase [Pelolinea submarina]REG08697.1 Ca2+-transporting ATPase [Pelolinea submarina]BBB47096.1 Ca2+-transporting ATPase [Pelolinea submarina]